MELYANDTTLMAESEEELKSLLMKVKAIQLCPTLCGPMDIQSMAFSRPEYWSGQSFLSPRNLPNTGIEPRSPALQADSLPAEPPGKTKNTGVGNLSLLQGIFPTQGSNLGLPRCRRILYQLSHKGSPGILEWARGAPPPPQDPSPLRGTLGSSLRYTGLVALSCMKSSHTRDQTQVPCTGTPNH